MRAYVQCAHYEDKSVSREWLSSGIRSPTPRTWKEKKRKREKEKNRDREKERVLETPWILETRIGLVRLMNIDEPFPTYLLARPHLDHLLQLDANLPLFFLLYLFSQSKFFEHAAYLSLATLFSPLIYFLIRSTYDHCKCTAVYYKYRQQRSVKYELVSVARWSLIRISFKSVRFPLPISY